MDNAKVEEQELVQFGVTLENSKLYRVEKDFLLDVRFGPLQPAKKGQVVRLSEKFGNELFFGNKISPLEISTVFEAVRGFRTIKDGEWLDVEIGDILKLERDEALKHLREGNVKESKGGIK